MFALCGCRGRVEVDTSPWRPACMARTPAEILTQEHVRCGCTLPVHEGRAVAAILSQTLPRVASDRTWVRLRLRGNRSWPLPPPSSPRLLTPQRALSRR